jgi:hypothetical protein
MRHLLLALYIPGLVMAGHFVLYIPQWWALPIEKKKKKLSKYLTVIAIGLQLLDYTSNSGLPIVWYLSD